MAKIKVTATLDDKVSAPAKKAAGSLDDLASSGEDASSGMDEADDASGGLAGSFEDLTGIAATTAGAIAAVAVVALAAAAAFLSALDQTRTLRNSLNGLDKGLGDAGGSFAALNAAMLATALPAEELRENFGKLRLAGQTAAAAQQFAILAANIKAAGGEGDALVDAIIDAVTVGKVEQGVFEAAGKALGGTAKLAEQLAKQLGVSAEEVPKLIELGKISPDQLVQAAKALGKDFSGLAKSSASFVDRISSVASVRFNQFGAAIMADDFGIINKLVSVFDSAITGAMKAAAFGFGFVTGAAKALGAAISNATKDSGLDSLGEDFGKLIEAMDPFLSVAKSIAGFMLGEFGSALKLAGIIIGGIIVVVAKFIQVWVRVVTVVAGAIGSVIGAIKSMAAPITAVFAGLDPAGWAKSLIDGLVNGIKNGASAVIAAAKNMATSIANAVKGALKIGSPSKLFESFGAFTAEGMQVGIEGGTKAASAAGAGLAAGVTGGAMGTMAAGAVGGGSSSSIGEIVININGASDPAATARAVEDQLRSVFAQMSMQRGA